MVSFTNSVGGASFLIAVTGFSSAVTQWAPFSLVNTATLKPMQKFTQVAVS